MQWTLLHESPGPGPLVKKLKLVVFYVIIIEGDPYALQFFSE